MKDKKVEYEAMVNKEVDEVFEEFIKATKKLESVKDSAKKRMLQLIEARYEIFGGERTQVAFSFFNSDQTRCISMSEVKIKSEETNKLSSITGQQDMVTTISFMEVKNKSFKKQQKCK